MEGKMRGTQFAELSAFVAVAEQRSFTRAARQLGLSPASLSQTVRAAEERLGLRLLNRTTRSVAPTTAGELLLDRLRPALDEIDSALESVNRLRDQPGGQLRLTVESAAADCVLGPILARFAAQFPQIGLDIAVDDAEIDIVANRFDAGIRLGGTIDRDMVAIRVSELLGYVVVGAPAYFARNSAPQSPEELTRHSCISRKFPSGSISPWRFERGGQTLKVPVGGGIVVNDVELALRAVRDGAGLFYVAENLVADALAAGELVAVLRPFMPRASDSFVLYYTSRRQIPSALRSLVDFLKADLRQREAERAPAPEERLCA